LVMKPGSITIEKYRLEFAYSVEQLIGI
jgi:hypothetical protein